MIYFLGSIYVRGIFSTINLTWGGYLNALLRAKWSENLKILPGIEPQSPWIEGQVDNQNATEKPILFIDKSTM